MKTTKTQKILFWSILLFAFIIRIIGLGTVPAGINQDEAMMAMDAWALSKYGTDRFGMQLPVHFTAWEYGHMSVLLAYFMVPFIWIFGFSTFAVRLPMAVISVAGVALMYFLSKKFFSANTALAVMAMTAINPWHFMQSRWSLDCNIFPHIFLLAFYLLLSGFEKKRYLYLSMVCFGLTFYCYGIAVYTVPLFLFLFAVWCLVKKEIILKDVLISALIFFVVALPEILVMFINMYELETIQTPLFTIPYFPYSSRSDDILLLNFSWYQLGRNALSLLKQAFLQYPDFLYNALSRFGPLYHLSTPFVFLGIIMFIKRFFTQRDTHKKTLDFALISLLLSGIWAGLITFEVNINRINIIFYSLILFAVYGIFCFVHIFPKVSIYLRNGFIIAYSILTICFINQYATAFAADIRTMFNVDFLEIAKEADTLENYETLYITSNVDWQINYKMSEILMQYVCKIDAQYFQGETNITGGRKLLPYSQRYHFMDIAYLQDYDKEALFVLHQEDLQYFSDMEYDIILEQGPFLAIDLR